MHARRSTTFAMPDGLSRTRLTLEMMHDRVDAIEADPGIGGFAVPQPPVQALNLPDDYCLRRLPRRIVARQSAGDLLQVLKSHADVKPCVDDPVGSRTSKRILTAVRLRSCVRPCRHGAMTAGPEGVRDPVPNNQAASRATGFNGISGSSVRPIAISLRSFTLASTRGSFG